ncbi:MAG TPA: hypothetical protein VHW09_20935 [Bryobacteraceae bacterium]|nr:hypothetical protein [Bryobacteraceae bacterium]
MSRFTDIRVQTPVRTQPSLLPPVDWAAIGAKAPAPVNLKYEGPSAPLPAADIVMFTWTSAEWWAMDHVFLHGSVESEKESSTLIHKWLQYSKGAPSGTTQGGLLWGYYQLVDIQGTRVLLMKADAHLAHPPYITGLEDMVLAAVADARPKRIYSIGTAGGAAVAQRLGDVAITNSGLLKLDMTTNLASGLNGETFTSNWFPSFSLMAKAQQLFFPLNRLATEAALESVLTAAKNSKHEGAKELQPFSLSDLMNAAIDPANLGSPKAVNFQGTPLLTTDFYYIADSDTAYACLEMDDAAVGHTAAGAGLDFVFVRNISDTLVPAESPSKQAIPAEARDAWSSAIYEAYGGFTSYNGALAAWATVAA